MRRLNGERSYLFVTGHLSAKPYPTLLQVGLLVEQAEVPLAKVFKEEIKRRKRGAVASKTLPA